MTENKKYYLLNLRQCQSHTEMTLFYEAIYSNGLKEIVKKWSYGQSIPTIIYDNGDKYSGIHKQSS